MISQISLFDEDAGQQNHESVKGEFQTAAWLLSLMELPGIGGTKAITLAKEFQSSSALAEANPELLKKLLRGAEINFQQLMYREVELLDDVKVVCYFDDNYPAGLRDLDTPPPVLWYRGSIPENAGVAIVGTREPSSRGAALAFEAGRIASEQGLAVVSGLALGIDSSAHKGSLESAGVNVAVLACDVRKPTPKSNQQMSEEILEKGGCLVAEVPPGTITEARNLVARNRIQAAWANGLVMAECGIPSGTLHTVRFAIQIERPVAVFDPQILGTPSPSNAGNLALSSLDGCDPEILGGTSGFKNLVRARKPCADSVLDSQESTKDFISSLK